jgi:hypothetical protein
MLTLIAMITCGVPDAPPAIPAAPLPRPRCEGCPSLATRHHPAGTAGPHGTSARCKAAEGGTRVIGWEWQPTDRPPHWCPKRSASA